VRDKVLLKPGPLTEEEWRVVRPHPAVGADIVGKIEMLRDVAGTIRYCREHWDGSGYPEGLAGERIPLAARILAVADAYDALRSDRPYRKAMDREAAVEAIRGRTGSCFDPSLVDLFIANRPGS
jgi:putative two-component system response regulator